MDGRAKSNMMWRVMLKKKKKKLPVRQPLNVLDIAVSPAEMQEELLQVKLGANSFSDLY